MQLSTPESAVLSAVIFNAIIIPLLIPLALRGVKYPFIIIGFKITGNEHINIWFRRSNTTICRYKSYRHPNIITGGGIMGEMMKELKNALLLFGIMALILGLIYPLVITGISQVIFPSSSQW